MINLKRNKRFELAVDGFVQGGLDELRQRIDILQRKADETRKNVENEVCKLEPERNIFLQAIFKMQLGDIVLHFAI